MTGPTFLTSSQQRRRTNKFAAIALLVPALLLASMSAGCIELQLWLTGTTNVPSDDGPGGGSGGGGNGGGSSNDPLRIRLTVSNSTPRMGEEVVFNCQSTQGDTDGLTYSFHPSNPRISYELQQGRASLVIASSDVGAEFTQHCTAQNAAGEVASSEEVSIIPAP